MPHESMSLKYEPAAVPQHISVSGLSLNSFNVQGGELANIKTSAEAEALKV